MRKAFTLVSPESPSAGGTPLASPARRPSPEVVRRRRLLAIITAVVLIPAALYALAALVGHGKVPKGTTVEGIAIGGLTPAAAQARLTKVLVPRSHLPVVVEGDGKRARVDPLRAGVVIDVPATVAQATSRGPGAAIAGLFGNAGAVAPVLRVDEKKLTTQALPVAARFSRPAVEGAIDFVGTTVVPVEPVVGRVVEPASVAAAIRSRVASADRQVTVPVTLQTPVLDASAVRQAADGLGRTVVSGPVSIRVVGAGIDGPFDESVTVPIDRLAPYLGTKVVDGKLALTVNSAGLVKELQPDLGPLEVPARNATFRIVKGRPVVVASRDGNSVGKELLASAVIDAASSNDVRVATVKLMRQPATLTTAQAKNLGVVEQLSTFTQRFPFAPYRYQNIGQAAKRINGTLLLPGQTFSMNRTVKERTVANGYTTGFIIKGGRLTEDLGGGVSTSATATWHAAFYAGLERIEQRAHSFWISRYEPGLEATVAWGSLDLKFRNDSPNAVFITATRGTNFITVTMYGTKRYQINAVFGPRTNVKPFREISDASTPCTPQGGVDGFRIVVTRVFKVDGAVVKREPLTTTYDAADHIVCGKPKPTPSPTPGSTAKPGATPKPTVPVRPKPKPTG